MGRNLIAAAGRFFILFACVGGAAAWTLNVVRPSGGAAAATGELRVWSLSVGQGESVFVQEPSGKRILYDGGPDDTSVLTELGTLLPAWDRRIDAVALSHTHSDHVRGLIAVLDRFEVGEVWMSGATAKGADVAAFLQRISDKKVPVRYFKAGGAFPFGDAQIRPLYPVRDYRGRSAVDAHDATLVLRVSAGENAVLLTGDLDERHEAEMLAGCHAPCTVRAQLLQVPHHGSATGLAPEFLKSVAPEQAFIPVGVGNSFNHPRPNVIARLQAAKIPFSRTDQDGGTAYAFTPGGLTRAAMSGSEPR